MGYSMVEFNSLRFWLIASLLVLLARLLGRAPETRRWLFFGATLLLYQQAPMALLSMLALAGWGFWALHYTANRWCLTLHLLLLASIFLWVLGSATALASAALLAWLPVVGLPYVTLRLAHLLIEIQGGRLRPPAFADYLCYLLPLHQFFAGPIERFAQYRSAMHRNLEPLTNDLVLQALNRLTNGLVKQLILAELLKRALGFQLARSGLPLWLEVDAFAIYIYLNFSGYMDIVIGLGRLAGWIPPENFDRPYLSRNIIVFWTRWHITLSQWIRDYVFIPINIALQRRLPRGSALLAGSISYLLAMALCGLWHRPELGFLLWGTIHGLAIIACKLYEASLKALLGKVRMKAYRRSPWTGMAATALTFHFVSLSFIFAFHPATEAWQIVGRLFGVG